MGFRNEKIATVVSTVVLIVGCWLADWSPGEDAAFLIVMSTFASGAVVIALLYEWERRALHHGSKQDR